MQCLYCKKRLGLFASKKFPYCSELHEVAYHDEMSGLALRRVLDPLFTAPVKSPPLRTTPEQRASPAGSESGAVALALPPDPPEQSFVAEARPSPIPRDPAGPSGLIEFEPFAGQVQLWSSGLGIAAFEADLVTPDTAAPDHGALKETRLEPIPSDLGVTDAPLEFESSRGPAQLASSGGGVSAFEPESATLEPAAETDLVVEAHEKIPALATVKRIRFEPIPFDLAATEAPLEFESSPGPVQLSRSSGVAPFDADSVGAEPTWELPALGILDEVRLEPIASDLAPLEVPLEFESSPGPVQLSRSSGVAPFDVDSVAAEPTWELPALGILDEVRLEPIASDLAPLEVPLEFESSPGPVQLSRSSGVAPFDADSVAAEPTWELPALGILDEVRLEPIPSDLAPLEMPLEFESSPGPVQLSRSSGGVASGEADSVAAEPTWELPALGILDEVRLEPIPPEVPFEFESSAGEVQVPLSGAVAPFEADSAAAEPTWERPALGILDEVRLEPIPSDLAPLEMPLEFESSPGPVQLSRSSGGVASGEADSVAAEPTWELPALGILDEVRLEPIPPEVPFEFESSAGEVQVPLSGAVAPFDVDSVAAEPTWERPALGILDEVRREPIPSDLAPPEVPLEFESSAWGGASSR